MGRLAGRVSRLEDIHGATERWCVCDPTLYQYRNGLGIVVLTTRVDQVTARGWGHIGPPRRGDTCPVCDKPWRCWGLGISEETAQMFEAMGKRGEQ